MTTTRPADFPRELQLVLHLARRALGRDHDSHPDPAAIDWPRFAATVERHRLAPFLHARAGAALAATCPPEIGTQMRAAAAESLRRSLAQTAELFRLLDALESATVPAFPVKGVALSQLLHGAIGARFASDLDLVVHPEHMERADAVLQAAGLRRTRPDFPLTAKQTRAYRRLKPEFEYVHERSGLRIELLWRLEGLRNPDRAVALELAGRATRTLTLEDYAVYLSEHGARHAWFRLFWLVDLALLFDRRDVDWTSVLARARAGGSERALHQGAALAAELLGSAVPSVLASAPASTALLAEARRQIVRSPRPNEPFNEWARQLRYRLRLARDPAAKWRVLAPHLLTPSNWQVWRLPDRWFWLYYPATPFLWLWRYLRRR